MAHRYIHAVSILYYSHILYLSVYLFGYYKIHVCVHVCICVQSLFHTLPSGKPFQNTKTWLWFLALFLSLKRILKKSMCRKNRIHEKVLRRQIRELAYYTSLNSEWKTFRNNQKLHSPNNQGELISLKLFVHYRVFSVEVKKILA